MVKPLVFDVSSLVFRSLWQFVREEFFLSRRSRSFSLALFALALAACDNEHISVYRIPKENNQVSLQTGSGNLALESGELDQTG